MNFSGASFWRYLALGVTLRGVSLFFEKMGAAPLGMGGSSGERVAYQVVALIVFVGAVYCGGKLVMMLIRSLNENPIASSRAEAEPVGFPEGVDFDPDVALSRYMQRRRGEEAVATPLTVKTLPAVQSARRRLV